MTAQTGSLAPYVPRVATEWDSVAPDSMWREIDGSLVFVDISGFTNLSEKLSRKGRIGAEELTAVLNRVFGQMLEAAFRRGGSLLKFGGDALLLFFDYPDHVMQACAAVVEMRAALRDAAKEPTSVGRIHLRMSSGVHTGSVDFFLVGDSHRELIVAGPIATATTDMEGTADGGEIVVSDAVKEQLPKDFIGDAKGDGWLLRKQKINWDAPGPIHREKVTEDQLATFVPTGLREYLGSVAGDSEHRIATVGFVKFKGSDVLLEELGPQAVARELDVLVRAIQRGSDKEEITFLASDIDANGGKIILTAGVPTSRHDDEGRMLRAGRTLLDARCGLSVRMGVNRGHVFSGDVGSAYRRTYTVMGDTVNLAARLMATAGPSELYASPAVLDRSTTLFGTEALEPFHVKGKDDLIQAYEVREEQGVRPPETKHELPFAGRDQELQLIVGIVTTCAASGSGGMMTITGDTGIGKTRLISEVLERCPGMDVLMVQAEPNGTNVPYWAFRDPMRKLLEIEWGSQEKMAKALEKAIRKRAPDLEWALPLLGDLLHIDIPDNEQTASLDPQFRPTRTADALIDFLDATCPGPFAAVAEDAHWMDAASIALLTRIGDVAERRPWTVVFTSRSDSDFDSQGTEIRLDPLTDDAVRTITIEATEAAPLRPHELEAVVGRAGGNPLFLSEILQMIRTTGNADSLPESLDAVVSSEIDTLPPLTRQVLRYAAVIGRSFSKLILDALVAPDHIEVDAATEKELAQFVETDETYRMRFRHAVVHDAAYEGLSYKRRRELHARAGEVIEALAGENPDSAAESLASHYYLSGKYDKAWHYSRVAGDKARKAYANAEAATHYRHAIESSRRLDDVSDAELVAVWAQLGDAREQAGLFDAALDAYRRASRLTGDDAIAKAELMLKRASARERAAQYPTALRETSIARHLVDGLDSTDAAHLEARAASFYSLIKFRQEKPSAAFSKARSAADIAVEANAKPALAQAYSVMAWTSLMLEREGADELTLKALELYRELDDLEGQTHMNNNLGVLAYFDGRWDEALNHYRRSRDGSERLGNAVDVSFVEANIGELLVNQFRLEEGESHLRRAARVARSTGEVGTATFAEIHLGRALMEANDLEAAESLLREVRQEMIERDYGAGAFEAALYLADCLFRRERHSEALALLDEASRNVSDEAIVYAPTAARVKASILSALGKTHQAIANVHEGLKAARSLNHEYEIALLLMLEADLDDHGSVNQQAEAEEIFSRLGVRMKV